MSIPNAGNSEPRENKNVYKQYAGIGITVNKTWAFMDYNEKEFVCLHTNEQNEEYIFLSSDRKYKTIDGSSVFHFSGKLYKIPDMELIKKMSADNIYRLLSGEITNNAQFIPELVKEVSLDIPMGQLSSLDKYVYDYNQANSKQ